MKIPRIIHSTDLDIPEIIALNDYRSAYWYGEAQRFLEAYKIVEQTVPNYKLAITRLFVAYMEAKHYSAEHKRIAMKYRFGLINSNRRNLNAQAKS